MTSQTVKQEMVSTPKDVSKISKYVVFKYAKKINRVFLNIRDDKDYTERFCWGFTPNINNLQTTEFKILKDCNIVNWTMKDNKVGLTFYITIYLDNPSLNRVQVVYLNF